MLHFPSLWRWVGLFLLAVFAFAWNLATGSVFFSWAELVEILQGAPHPQQFIIWQIRLPRTCLAFVCGAILSLGGLYMQTLIRNPLADPYIMGLTSGAGLAVNLLLAGFFPAIVYTIWTVPLVAWLGATFSLGIVVAIGWNTISVGNEKFLLAGVATSSLCVALTGLVIYKFSTHQQAAQMLFWTLGSFDKTTWAASAVSGGLLLILLFFGQVFARRMDVLMLGESQAQTLGVNVASLKLALLLITSCCVGGLVGFTGPIGFVGMMIPHLTRTLFGSNHRQLLLPCAAIGGIYLSCCDTLSRLLLPPAGLPIGIVTALLGVPFFLYILAKKDKIALK